MSNIETIKANLTQALAQHPVAEIGKPKPKVKAKVRRQTQRDLTNNSRSGRNKVLKATNRNLCTEGGRFNKRHGSQITGTIRLHDIELDEMH